MAAPVQLLAQNSGFRFNTTPWVSDSFIPSNSVILIATVAARANTNSVSYPTDLIISGGDLTWTRRTGAGTGRDYLAQFTAPVSTGASMAITLSLNGFEITDFTIEVCEKDSYDTGSPVGAIAEDSALATDGSDTITLNSVPASTSYVIAAVGREGSNAGNGTTVGTGWTELGDSGQNSGTGVQVQYSTSSTSTTVTWDDIGTGEAVGSARGVAVEIKEAGAAAPTSYLPTVAKNLHLIGR